jgi:hypothetical protein
MWLRRLLPPEIPQARILTYGYDSRTHSSEHLTRQTLFGHSATLVSALSLYRRRTKVCMFLKLYCSFADLIVCIDGTPSDYFCCSQSGRNRCEKCQFPGLQVPLAAKIELLKRLLSIRTWQQYRITNISKRLSSQRMASCSSGHLIKVETTYLGENC